MIRTVSVILLALLPFSLAPGSPGVDVSIADRIEEDWQIVITTPGPSVDGPQITTSMNPGVDDSSTNMIFNVNYQDYPTFVSGGVQIKVWQGKQVASSSTQGSGQLQTSNESITWTQRMSLSGGNLNFKILSGASTTWPTFGQADTDLAAVAPTTLASLVGYSPDTSVAKSAVSYAASYVGSMTLVRVRYYQGSTLLYTDDTARAVSLTQ